MMPIARDDRWMREQELPADPPRLRLVPPYQSESGVRGELDGRASLDPDEDSI